MVKATKTVFLKQRSLGQKILILRFLFGFKISYSRHLTGLLLAFQACFEVVYTDLVMTSFLIYCFYLVLLQG